MHPTAIFEIQNHMPDDAATAEGGDGGIKVEFAVSAVGAIKRAGYRSRKWLGTLRAKWRTDPHQLRFALFANVFPRIDIVAAARADRRIKKGDQRGKQISSRHFVSSSSA